MHHTITGTIVGVISEIRPSFETFKGGTIRILKVKEPGGILTYPQLHDSEHLLGDFKLGDKAIIYVKAFGKEVIRDGKSYQYHTLVIQDIEKWTIPQAV